MKKLLLMLAVPMFLAFSLKAGNVNVKVNIANAYGKTVNIKVADKTYEIKMNEAGKGSVDIDIVGEAFATFDYPRVMAADLYLTEGKNIEITFDLKNRGNDLAVKCDDRGVNAYLFDLKKNNPIAYEDYKLGEAEFLSKIDAVLEQKTKELDPKPFSKMFKKIQRVNLLYSLSGNLAMYPDYHVWMTKKDDYKPSEKFYNKLEGLVKEYPEHLILNSYKQFMKEGIMALGAKDVEEDDNTKVATEASKIAAKLKTQSFKEELIYGFTDGAISRSGIDGTDDLLKLFVANVKDPKKVEAINKLVEKWSKLAKGLDSPKFNYKDINGKMVSLDDLKGKYVYIDCWATWCGPCCREIPHLQKLEHDYASKNIHFVSISCDRDIKAWENKVKTDNLGGVQLNIGKDRAFMNAYMVIGIPRFILLDKEGKIVTAVAPRPSSKQIRRLFDSLNGL